MAQDKVPFICPACRTELLISDLAYHCYNCNKDYLIKDGVVCFLDKNDTFYEGTYKATVNFTTDNEKSLKSLLYLYFINTHYLWYIKKFVKSPSMILDVACGGGINYLSQKGKVTGIDLSFDSLKKTTEFYELSVQADALNMPFLDAYYDVVTSCYSFEHFNPSKKEQLLKQFYRVLRPGGKMILLFDCDNNNPLFYWLKKYPDLYKKCFVDHDHHYGLQLPSENINLINNSGFKVLEYRAANKTPFQHLPVFGWIKPYDEESRFAGIISSYASYIGNHRITNLFYQAFVTVFDDIIEKILPLNWARLLLVVAEKE